MVNNHCKIRVLFTLTNIWIKLYNILNKYLKSFNLNNLIN